MLTRLKPRLYDLGMRLAAPHMDPRRKALVAEAAGTVLELGVGTGQNLRFYDPGVRVIGVEPDSGMLEAAVRRADRVSASIQLVFGAGEGLPFRDGVFDQVVASLVLCSVASPARTLSEARRVLKPDGRLRFYEHIRSESAAWARMQDFITPVWKRLADGCCPNRATVQAVGQAGFVIESLEAFPLGPYPTRPQVVGVARPSS